MSTYVSPEVKQDLKALNKHANDLLAVDLKYALQPGYAGKARQSVDALLTFATPLHEVLNDPRHIHHTALDTGLKNLQAVGKALAGHYTDPGDQAAIKQAHEVSFKAVLADIKKLRTEVPREEVPTTSKPTAKI
jgi:hypothetical protein